MSDLTAAGALTVDVCATYPTEQLAAAFAASMGGRGGGKIVMTEFTS
ncbi:MAG: hypothetical protein ABI053_03440 [Lacisediminihabitans sp.]